jgi:hypothetical protein
MIWSNELDDGKLPEANGERIDSFPSVEDWGINSYSSSFEDYGYGYDMI